MFATVAVATNLHTLWAKLWARKPNEGLKDTIISCCGRHFCKQIGLDISNMPSAAVMIYPTLLLQSWNYHNAICHVLVEIKKHGSSQFVHYYMLSINSPSKKEHHFITWPPEVLYRPTLPTWASTSPVCTYIEVWDPWQKLHCWTLLTFLAAYAMGGGGCNIDAHQNAGLVI